MAQGLCRTLLGLALAPGLTLVVACATSDLPKLDEPPAALVPAAAATPSASSSNSSPPYPELQIETDTAGDSYGLTETVVPRTPRKAGFGAECASSMGEIEDHLAARKLAFAAQELDTVLSCFDTRMSEDARATYRAFATEDELSEYRRENPDTEPLVALDWSYAEALASQAYTLVARRRFTEALERLHDQMDVAPYSAAPHMEAGFIYYSAYRQPYRALHSYKEGLALARRFPSSSDLEPIGLRGMGFALIEIGHLDEAEGVLRESLDLDPGNPTALSELEYIDHLRTQGPYAR